MLTLNDTMQSAIVKLSEGNPGAMAVLSALAKRDDGLIRILDVDDMGMRGPSIWLGYKDHCKQDIDAFAVALRDRSPEMVRTIKVNGGEAWTGGKS